MNKIFFIIIVLTEISAHAASSTTSENYYKNLFKNDDQGFGVCVDSMIKANESLIDTLYNSNPAPENRGTIRFIQRYFTWPGFKRLRLDIVTQMPVKKHPDTPELENPDLFIFSANYASCEYTFGNDKNSLNYVTPDIFSKDPRILTLEPIACGSAINFAKKTVVESIPIEGTGFSLNYSSEFNANINANKKFKNTYTLLKNINNSYRQVVTDTATGLEISNIPYNPMPPFVFNADVDLGSSNVSFTGNSIKSTANISVAFSAVESPPLQCYDFYFEDGRFEVRCVDAIYFEDKPRAWGVDIGHVLSPTDLELEKVEKKITVYHPEIWGLSGWTISEHHYFDRDNKVLYAGYGEKVQYAELKTINDSSLGIVDVVLNKRNENELFIFDQEGKHLETRDVILGHVIHKFAYDTQKKLLSISDRFNNRVSFIYNSGVLTKIVSAENVETDFVVQNNNLATATDPEGFQYEMTYDNLGLLKSFKSIDNVETLLIYNSDGEFEKEEKNNGLIQAFTSVIIEGVEVLRKNLNFGKAREIANFVTQEGSFSQEIDNDGNVVFEEKRSFAYNTTTKGFEKDKITEAFSTSQEWGEDKVVVQSSVHENTESDQNIRSETSVNESREYANFNDVLNLKNYQTVVSSNGAGYSTSFSKDSNKFTIQNQFGVQTDVILNAQNLISRTESTDRFPTDFQYDSKGRLIKVIKGNQFESYSYDNFGYLISTNNNKGQLTQYLRNKKGQLIKKILPNQDTVIFEYSSGGEVKKIIAPNGESHIFEMSLGDYISNAVTPKKKSTQYTYDSDKRIKDVIKPSGKTLAYEYEAGKPDLKKITISEGQVTINSRDLRSRITSITSADSIKTDISWVSDAIQSQTWYDNGELIAKLSNTFAADQFKVSATYLNENLVGSFSYQNSVLKSIDNLGFNYEHQFLDKSHILKISNNSGFYIDYTEQDSLISEQPEQITSARVIDGPDTQLFITLKRAYDNFGQATEFTTTTLNESTGTYNSYFSLIPKYDENNRLVRIDKSRKSFADGVEVSSLDFVNQYLYPAKSNNNVKTYQQSISADNQQLPLKRTFASHNEDDQLTKLQGSINRDYKYDDDGNLSEMSNCYGKNSYEYDSFGNLKKVTLSNGKVIEYKVDGFNRRFKQLINGQVTEYYLWYDQIRLAAVLDSNKNAKSIYIYGSESSNVPGYVIKDGKTYKIIHDPGTQSVRYVVDSENAMVVQEFEYDENGNIMKATNAEFQPITYAGGLYDLDTKFVRFGARDYDPTIGRWTTKDPIGFNGGDTNLYAYVGGDPMSYVDPSGLSAKDVLRIQQAFNNSVTLMNQQGMRSPGTGYLNGMNNNLQFMLYAVNMNLLFGKAGNVGNGSFMGCESQANFSKDHIVKNTNGMDDSWKFEAVQNATKTHFFLRGTSSNPNDPVLTIDPWLNSFSK